MANETLDSTDWKILSILQSNAAIPNIELAEMVFLSPSPCSRRVKNLEEKGYISKRVSLLDPIKAGLPVTVFVQVTLDHQVKKELDDFASQVASWPEVMECYLMTGNSDYLIRLLVSDIKTLEAFIVQKLSTIDGVLNIQSSFALKQVKYKTELPINSD